MRIIVVMGVISISSVLALLVWFLYAFDLCPRDYDWKCTHGALVYNIDSKRKIIRSDYFYLLNVEDNQLYLLSETGELIFENFIFWKADNYHGVNLNDGVKASKHAKGSFFKNGVAQIRQLQKNGNPVAVNCQSTRPDRD